MNREIKFRAKRVKNEEWVIGSLVKVEESYFITPSAAKEVLIYGAPHIHWDDLVLVNPETVGQFTGLKDKNGKEIYEGDILREVPKDHWEKDNYSCFEVFFHGGDANSDYNIGFSMDRMHNHGAICGGYIPRFKPKSCSKMIVFGNIHDNPELIKR